MSLDQKPTNVILHRTVSAASDPSWAWKPYGQGVVEIMTFPGGEPHVKVHEEGLKFRGRDFTIECHASSATDLVKAFVLNDFLRRSGARTVHLYLPYLPGARQDRGVPLTCKVYADMINAQRFDTVTALDPHSDVMPALIDNFQGVSLVDLTWMLDLRSFLGVDYCTVVVVPDVGAVKRSRGLALRFGVASVQADKARDPHTGELSGFGVGPIPEHAERLLVVDDICDGGGTFLGLADKIRETAPDIRLDLFVTHGIFSKGHVALSERFDSIYTTDSFPSYAPHRIPVTRAVLDNVINPQHTRSH